MHFEEAQQRPGKLFVMGDDEESFFCHQRQKEKIVFSLKQKKNLISLGISLNVVSHVPVG